MQRNLVKSVCNMNNNDNNNTIYKAHYSSGLKAPYNKNKLYRIIHTQNINACTYITKYIDKCHDCFLRSPLDIPW